jgi:RHS repeat-associated protein
VPQAPQLRLGLLPSPPTSTLCDECFQSCGSDSPGETAVYNSNGLQYYRHADWLGSAPSASRMLLRDARLTSTPSRTVTGDVAYAPFGETYASSGSPDVSFAFSASRMQLRDTGQKPDTNANLYDFMYREYGIQGRWPSPDPPRCLSETGAVRIARIGPLGSGAFNLADPQSLNLYAYVRNTPMTQVDPLGLTGVGVCNTWATKLRIGPMPSCTIPTGGGGEGPPDDGCGIDGGFGPCSLGGDGYASAICPDNDCGYGSPAGEYQRDAAGNCGYGRFNDIGLAPPQTQTEQGCEKTILSAGNTKFGTNFTASNVVGEPFQHSTFGPAATQTVNLNISAGSQISGVAPGRYPLHWWTYAFGIGPTLHIPAGPGGLDSGQTIPFGQNNDYTEHLDNAYAGWNPLGDLLHGVIDVFGIGRNSCP